MAFDPANVTVKELLASASESHRYYTALCNVSLILRTPMVTGADHGIDRRDIAAIVDEALRTPEAP